MKNIYSFIALALIVLSTSCTKLNLDEATQMGYDASLGVPVCKFHSSILEILTKYDTTGYINIDPSDHTLHFYWSEKEREMTFNFLETSGGDTISQSLDLTKQSNIKAWLDLVPEGTFITLPEASYTVRDTLKYTFSFNRYTPGVKEYTIDSILIDKANIELLFNMSGITLGNNNRVELSIKIPKIKGIKNSEINVIINKTQMHINRVLTDIIADFSDQTTGGDNEVSMIFEYKIVSDGTATISKGAKVDYTAAFNNIKFNVARGRFWDSNAIYDTVVGIKMPDVIRSIAKSGDNKLLFHNPEMMLFLRHDVGIDVRYVIDFIRTLDKDGNVLKYADFSGSQSLSNYLQRPAEPYMLAYDTIVLDRNNGKTNDLFSILPDSMELGCHVYVGKPDGGHNDFVVNPMKLVASVDAHLEMQLDPGSYYSNSDTIKADISGVDTKFLDYVNIDEFNIILLTANSLPVAAKADFVMLDENNNELYKYENFELECPEVDETGKSIAPTNQEIRLVFVGEDIKSILRTKKIYFKVTVEGEDAQAMISFCADDAVDITVSAFAKFKANLDNILK